MASEYYVDENGNIVKVSGTINTAELLPISGNDPTDTKSYIDTGLSGKADKNLTSIIKTLTLTQANFTWDESNKRYISSQTFSDITSGKTVLSIYGYFINGGSLFSYRVDNSGYLNVLGWIPLMAGNITSSYNFNLYILYI